MTMRIPTVLIVLALALAGCVQSPTAQRDVPSGPVVLTVTGDIENTNRAPFNAFSISDTR